MKRKPDTKPTKYGIFMGTLLLSIMAIFILFIVGMLFLLTFGDALLLNSEDMSFEQKNLIIFISFILLSIFVVRKVIASVKKNIDSD